MNNIVSRFVRSGDRIVPARFSTSLKSGRWSMKAAWPRQRIAEPHVVAVTARGSGRSVCDEVAFRGRVSVRPTSRAPARVSQTGELQPMPSRY